MFENAKYFIVKVTRDCNLRCKYCYIPNKDIYKNEVMSFDVFKDFVNRIVDDKVRNNKYDRFGFVFHGGEPTLIGYETLSKYISYAYTVFKNNNLEAQFSVQTNGTLLNDNFLNLFKDYNVNLGISYDGFGSNNEYRTLKPTEYYEDIIHKINKSHILLNNLCVVSKSNIDNMESIFEYFKKLGLCTSYNFSEDTLNIGNCEIPGEEYFNKCIKPMVDLALSKKNLSFIPDHKILRLLISYINRILVKDTNLREAYNSYNGICSAMFCGGGCRALEISPDGSINSCGRNNESKERCIGTIYSKDFLGLRIKSIFYDKMYEKNKAILDLKCDLCESRDICNFGCIEFSYSKRCKYDIDTNLICSYFKSFKKYIYDNSDILVESYVNHIINNPSHKLNLKCNISDTTVNNINRVLYEYNINYVRSRLVNKNNDKYIELYKIN